MPDQPNAWASSTPPPIGAILGCRAIRTRSTAKSKRANPHIIRRKKRTEFATWHILAFAVFATIRVFRRVRAVILRGGPKHFLSTSDSLRLDEHHEPGIGS